MPSVRLDVLAVERGLAESREQAQRLIRAGDILVAGQPVYRPSQAVAPDAVLELKQPPRFVGRGGEKLEAAFEGFALDVSGKVCLDVGASTGGFTDCLLQHGAAAVYAVDVGKGQLHWKLRQDPRVTVIDEFNARNLAPALFPRTPQFACVDVSFISLRLILPSLARVLAAGSEVVTLIKPQFEAGRERVGKGGVVRDPAVHAEVVEAIRLFGTRDLPLSWLGVRESPVRGPAGNIEFLAHWRLAG